MVSLRCENLLCAVDVNDGTGRGVINTSTRVSRERRPAAVARLRASCPIRAPSKCSSTEGACYATDGRIESGLRVGRLAAAALPHDENILSELRKRRRCKLCNRGGGFGCRRQFCITIPLLKSAANPSIQRNHSHARGPREAKHVSSIVAQPFDARFSFEVPVRKAGHACACVCVFQERMV